ncbi:hypothetical protein DFP73DRAFT_542410, partial [Morchella snyderi]
MGDRHLGGGSPVQLVPMGDRHLGGGSPEQLVPMGDRHLGGGSPGQLVPMEDRHLGGWDRRWGREELHRWKHQTRLEARDRRRCS